MFNSQKVFLAWFVQYSGGSNTEQVWYLDGPLSYGSSPNQLNTEIQMAALG